MTTTTDPTPEASPDTRPRAGRGARRLAIAALVLGAAGNTAEAVLGHIVGDKPEAVSDQLALIADRSALVTTVLVVGTLAVPFMALGFVAAARELHRRLPRLAWLAGSLLVVGMWGFLGMHTLALIGLAALEQGDAAAAGFLSDEAYTNVVLEVLFGQPFFIGVVLGMLTLNLALLVTGVVPRWIPACWLLFIVLDFSIGAVGPVDPHWLFLAGAVGLAVHLHRGGARPRIA
jgi:hypothetical protein